MSTGIDWGKLIGGIIAAVLITLQVGVSQKVDNQTVITNRDVKRVEDNTMHKSTIEKHVADIETRFGVVEREFMPKTDIFERLNGIDADWKILNTRMLEIERSINALYTEPGGG